MPAINLPLEAFRDMHVRINDVALRDGLQIEPDFVPTNEKIALVNRLSESGLTKIEVTSFTSPRAIPALRDAEQVMKQIVRADGVEYVALVPNMRGAERALDCKVDEINLVMSASETHNLCNLRMTCAQSRSALANIVATAKGQARLNLSISTAFGCPMEGVVSPDAVLALADWFIEQGVEGITLCDTTGMANPAQVLQLCAGLPARWPGIDLTLHFHNTRGMGLANVLAGLSAGIFRYDASLGGLGGCPYAPGATGNICTEDLVHMLLAMQVNCAVKLDVLLDAADRLETLVGHPLPGQIRTAGPWNRRYPTPEDFGSIRQRALQRSTSQAASTIGS